MEILTWLNGKKTIIGVITSLIIGFLQVKQIIDETTALFALSISGLIFGIGVTHKVQKRL